MPTGIRITEDKKRQVIETYSKSPITLTELSELSGLSNPTIIKILDEYNVERYKKAQIFNPELDECYFDVIDKESKAYFLGLIITDGNVFSTKDGNRQRSISITQSSSDEYILEIFKNEIKANTSIVHDGRGCSQIAVRSNMMADSLARYGIVPNKTLTTKLPLLSEEYMPHLIRGILDGDGNIKAHQTNIKNRYAHALSFCGTYQLMHDLNEYLHNEVNVERQKIYSYLDKHLSEIKWQSKDSMKKICDWMYANATIYLTRKHDIYLDFINHYYS